MSKIPSYKINIKYIALLAFSLVIFANIGSAQINLQTTVMVNPQPNNSNFDQCGTEHSIVVNQGTPILFCYRVTNTGSFPYNFHDASSPYFGTVLNNFPFILKPDSSVYLTERENVMSTVNFDGTWTAHNNSLTPRYIIKEINYNFDDISFSGTNLNLGDDGETNVNLDFDFSLSGIYSNKMTVGNNGAIRFGESSVNISNANYSLSILAYENIIAPFWDDLTPNNLGGTVYYETVGTTPNRVTIIQWEKQRHYNLSTGISSGDVTFQIKLFETTNEIQFHYKDVTFDDTLFDNGLGATVGIGGASNAIEHSFNQASLTNLSALSFTRPDSVGYIVTKSGEIGGPNYNFVDISGTGTPLNLADDGEANVTMNFPFFMSNYSSKFVTIGNNGALRLGQSNANINAGNVQLSNDMAGNIIAPFWDDLTDTVGNVYYQTIGNPPFRTFIVQWDNRPHYIPGGGATPGSVTFELKLFEINNRIEFHYQNIDFDETTATNTGYDFGQSATVGISGGINLAQFSYNTTEINDNMALMFTPSARSASSQDSAIVIVRPDEIFANGFE